MGTQKNCLIETILLSTHNIGFGLMIREILWEKELLTPYYLHLCQTKRHMVLVYFSEDGGEEVESSMKTNYDGSEEVFLARKMSTDNLVCT